MITESPRLNFKRSNLATQLPQRLRKRYGMWERWWDMKWWLHASPKKLLCLLTSPFFGPLWSCSKEKNSFLMETYQTKGHHGFGRFNFFFIAMWPQTSKILNGCRNSGHLSDMFFWPISDVSGSRAAACSEVAAGFPSRFLDLPNLRRKRRSHSVPKPEKMKLLGKLWKTEMWEH